MSLPQLQICVYKQRQRQVQHENSPGHFHQKHPLGSHTSLQKS